MKIVLTALNAKYIHTALALYSLKAYAKENSRIMLLEFEKQTKQTIKTKLPTKQMNKPKHL